MRDLGYIEWNKYRRLSFVTLKRKGRTSFRSLVEELIKLKIDVLVVITISSIQEAPNGRYPGRFRLSWSQASIQLKRG